MLIRCPECELQISDKAISCPHCGLPMTSLQPSNASNASNTSGSNQTRKRTKAHMRLPNGFGQISKMSNPNLRNPYRAMITVGKTETGRPISKILKPRGYFETYNDAYEALIEYNKNPYDLDTSMTVAELYEKWTADYFKTVTAAYTRTIKSAWSYCDKAKKINIKHLRVGHIKDCMETTDSDNIKNRIKSMFNLMLDYALEYGWVDKNYARDFKTEAAEVQNEHMSFTDEEMKILWKNESIPEVNIVLFQCYTGWRPQEVGLVKLEDVDLEKGIIVSGMKTDAGRNRIVPICSKIRRCVEKLYSLSTLLGSKYLCCDNDGSLMTYDKYKSRFARVRDDLKLDGNHRPHDPRKQFVTMCKKAGVDEYAIKRIVGHKIKDLTERVYTDRDYTWLQAEVEKICN